MRLFGCRSFGCGFCCLCSFYFRYPVIQSIAFVQAYLRSRSPAFVQAHLRILLITEFPVERLTVLALRTIESVQNISTTVLFLPLLPDGKSSLVVPQSCSNSAKLVYIMCLSSLSSISCSIPVLDELGAFEYLLQINERVYWQCTFFSSLASWYTQKANSLCMDLVVTLY